MNKPSSCRYCEAEIVLARTRSGYWKALNPEPVSSVTLKDFGAHFDSFLVDRKTRLLVPLKEVAEPPFWSYLEHRCAEYLEARSVAPIPEKGEQGLSKLSDSPELSELIAVMEARKTIEKIKEARKAREQLTERARLNVE